MLIPLSRGRETAQPTLQQHTPMTGLSEIGNSIGGAVQARDEKLQEQEVRDKLITLQNYELQKKQDTANYVQQSAKFSSDVDLIDSNITARIQSGELSSDVAIDERQKSLEKIKQQYLPEIPDSKKSDFDQYFEKTSYQSASKYMPVIQRAEQSQAAVQLNDVSENLLKSSASLEDGEKSIREFGLSKNLPIGLVESTIGKYKNTSSTNGIRAWFNGNMDDNEKLSSMSTPEKILEMFPNLTQEQAIDYSQRSLSRISQNNKATEVELKRMEADAKDAVTEMRQITSTGIIPDDNKVQELYARVKGTDQAVQFQKLAGVSAEVRNFIGLPPDVRQSYLSKLEAESRNSPSNDPQGLSFRLGLLKEANSKMLNDEKNNASLAYSIKTGKTLPVAPTTLIALGDAKAISILTSNIKTIAASHQMDGITGSLNPLSQQQQQEMKEFISTANSSQKLLLGTSLFKASAGNAVAARDMINSVFGNKNSIRWAVALNNRNHSIIANQIVSGQDLLDKQLVKLNDTALNFQTTEYLKGIVSPGSPEFSIYYDSVKANYAYLAQKSEKLTDKSGKIDTKSVDPELFKKAALEVTGGKFTSGAWGSRNTVLRPHSVSEKSFRDQLERFNSQHYRDYGGSDKDFFLDLPLEQDPKDPYRYYFKNGANYIYDRYSNKDPKKQTRLSLVLR
ncbi:hypothetical protein [Acinetobacter bereziniae]|uniref:hypothetical protein n=1 Tax=Acinetobacter bereziniae TaxID=106648 RepID=UPI00300881FC